MRKMHILRWMKDLCVVQAILLISCFWIAQPASAQMSEDLRSQIDKIILHDTEISFAQIPGFIVAILDQDSAYYLSFGTRERGTTEPISRTDIFQTGSLSKVFTAHLLLNLHDRGVLEIDHPLNNFLPEESRNPLFHGTLREIMQHQSGLPKLPQTLGSKENDLNSPYSGFTKDDLLTWYRDFRPQAKGFRYSHAGYALLEIALEHKTGEPYPKLFQREIREAYNLRNAQVALGTDLTPGYDLAGRKTIPWSFQSFAASKGVSINAEDLITYLDTLMYESSIPLFWNLQLPTDDKKLFAGPGWYAYYPKKDFPVYVHTGRTSGHAVMAAFAKKTHTAVVVLSNSSAGTDDLALLVLRMINKQWKRKAH